MWEVENERYRQKRCEVKNISVKSEDLRSWRAW